MFGRLNITKRILKLVQSHAIKLYCRFGIVFKIRTFRYPYRPISVNLFFKITFFILWEAPLRSRDPSISLQHFLTNLQNKFGLSKIFSFFLYIHVVKINVCSKIFNIDELPWCYSNIYRYDLLKLYHVESFRSISKMKCIVHNWLFDPIYFYFSHSN